MSLDSSILISHLSGDIHQEAVLAAIECWDALGAELTLPLLCSAEIWTGIAWLDEMEQQQQTLPPSTRSCRLARFCW
jgi:hypothetical protein